VEEVCRHLSAGGIAILLVEQNLEMAQSLAHRAYVFVNGRVARDLPAATLATEPHLLRQLLEVTASTGDLPAEQPRNRGRKRRLRNRQGKRLPKPSSGPSHRPCGAVPASRGPGPEGTARTAPVSKNPSALLQVSVAETIDRAAYIVGTSTPRPRTCCSSSPA